MLLNMIVGTTNVIIQLVGDLYKYYYLKNYIV